ncbi:methyltransferase domain-containing protein [Streptomyces iconiensis]|uniref:Class I SAM-dependent methyltransferase n=1 Tax=Streptomyces iconiensis TaxID=1384038 RepID=A0ABT6ZQB7_9ACTN|nr:class I SAM-dependent methyltransferase [Streptomyces iconiensis]MDJ1131255.1 class I SAM-dependent methyltransferase [Streptomyces iconiensis]
MSVSAKKYVNDGQTWEDYWRKVQEGRVGAPPWNWDPEQAAHCYLSQRGEHCDPALPLVDVGCGDGFLTHYLARTHGQVVGTEISAAALQQAQATHAAANISYEPLDITDTEAARALHDRLGDANVHLRGVLHAIEAPDRRRAVSALAVLAGERGTVFDIEISPALDAAQASAAASFGALPERMQQVGSSGLRAQRISLEDLVGLYQEAGCAVRACGETSGRSSMRLPDGSCFVYPMVYVLVTAGEM